MSWISRGCGLVVVGLMWVGCSDDGELSAVDGETDSGDPTSGGTGTADGPDTSDPTGPGGSSGGTAEGSSGAADSTGGGGAEFCGTMPTRFLAFGDSILQCFGQPAEKQDPGCSPFIVHDWLDENVSPGITYENLAVGGAVTTDVPASQMPSANVGQSGHALVLVGIGGNDLAPSLLASDAEAQATYDEKIGDIEAAWEQMLAFVDDPANFPDGVTLVVDNQYDPFDGCTSDPFAFMTPTKIELLADFNQRIVDRLAGREDSHVADIHQAFLGHGHHYENGECPYTMDGGEYWMLGGNDLIHPNTAGHAGIAEEIISVLEGVYACP